MTGVEYLLPIGLAALLSSCGIAAGRLGWGKAILDWSFIPPEQPLPSPPKAITYTQSEVARVQEDTRLATIAKVNAEWHNRLRNHHVPYSWRQCWKREVDILLNNIPNTGNPDEQ